MHQAAKAYFETQITTTSPGKVLLMLYDGALNYLAQAKERIDAKDPAGKGILISKALDVINELASSLNAEKGGDLAANLTQLYFYCNKRLFMANLKMDNAIIDEVMTILSGIRSAYAQILDTPEAVAASQEVEMNRKAAPQQAAVPMKHAVAAPLPLAAKQARMRGAYAQQFGAGAAPAAPFTSAEAPTAASLAPAEVPAVAPTMAMPEPAADAPMAPVSSGDTASPAEASVTAPGMAPVLFTDFDETVAGAEDAAPEAASAPPPSMLGANKRLAASALYRKFSS